MKTKRLCSHIDERIGDIHMQIKAKENFSKMFQVKLLTLLSLIMFKIFLVD